MSLKKPTLLHNLFLRNISSQSVFNLSLCDRNSVSESTELWVFSTCVVNLPFSQETCRRRTKQENNIPDTTEHFYFMLTNWILSIFYPSGIYNFVICKPSRSECPCSIVSKIVSSTKDTLPFLVLVKFIRRLEMRYVSIDLLFMGIVTGFT